MLTKAVVERIKGAIESGSLPAGSAIGQQELADRLGVSRQPIRQALPLLIAEGWIESLPNRRLLVRELAAEEVDEIFAVRRLIEPVALAASIERATPAMLRRLNFALTEYEEAATPAELESADVAFHEALYSGCDNAKNSPPASTSLESIAKDPTLLSSEAGSICAEVSADMYWIAVLSFKFCPCPNERRRNAVTHHRRLFSRLLNVLPLVLCRCLWKYGLGLAVGLWLIWS